MNSKKLKILIVEDEFIFALDTKSTLEELGYEVAGMETNFDDTIALVEETKPDLMLMDINIKGDVDGIQTAQYINELYHIPSLFLSAYNDEETCGKVSQVNSLGLLTKPLDDKEFQEVMNTFRQSRQAS